MAKIKDILINFSIAGLIVFSIMAFGIGLQLDNNAEDNLTDDTFMNDTYSELRGDLSDFRDTSQTQRELFEREEPTASLGSLILFSIISSGRTLSSMTMGVFNLLIKVPAVYLGIDPVVFSVITAIVIMLLILGLYSLYKIGS